jgi:hypothetical protein
MLREMGESLAILKQIRALIERLAPEPICDDCITERLSLEEREESGNKIGELAGMAGFERRIDSCAMCGATKKVTRRSP